MRTLKDPLACNDLIAERRYAYGRAAADDSDFAAAAELFEQALEQAPGWAPAWFALAQAREKLGDREGAVGAYRSALGADPSDALGAGPRLSLLCGKERLDALPTAYVTRLFDDYAPRFNEHLTKTLGYRGPALIAEALEAAAPGRRFASALDIGCGAGLMGKAIRPRVDRLRGVDLSPAMVAKARGLYDALAVADATAFLQSCAPGTFDLMLAADALCYFGDLTAIFTACRRALADEGLFAFSVERFEGDGFRLQDAMRFAHGRDYVGAVARDAGFRSLYVAEASPRTEAGVGAQGLVCVMQAE